MNIGTDFVTLLPHLPRVDDELERDVPVVVGLGRVGAHIDATAQHPIGAAPEAVFKDGLDVSGAGSVIHDEDAVGGDVAGVLAMLGPRVDGGGGGGGGHHGEGEGRLRISKTPTRATPTENLSQILRSQNDDS